MRWLPLTVIGCVLLSGCEGSSPPGGAAPGPDQATVAPAPPATVAAGSLAVYPIDERDGKVTVGEDVHDVTAETLLDAPKKKLPTSTLPKGLSPDDYSVLGWESVDGTEGAGFISNARTHKVIAVIVRYTVADADAAKAVVDKYTSRIPDLSPTVATYGDSTYCFWEDGNNRLMILETPAKGDKMQLTLALGVKPVLDFLRADPMHARIDGVKVKSLPPTSTTKDASTGP